jgi:hypothetical protein
MQEDAAVIVLLAFWAFSAGPLLNDYAGDIMEQV